MKIFTSLLLIILFFLLSNKSIASEIYEISLCHFPLKGAERITGIKINLKSGRFYSIPRMPAGWNIIIDNDPSWMTTFNGNIIVGAAALNKLDSVLMDHFIVIEKLEDEVISKNVPFFVEIEVSLIDFNTDKERVVNAKKNMFELRKLKNTK